MIMTKIRGNRIDAACQVIILKFLAEFEDKILIMCVSARGLHTSILWEKVYDIFGMNHLCSDETSSV